MQQNSHMIKYKIHSVPGILTVRLTGTDYSFWFSNWPHTDSTNDATRMTTLSYMTVEKDKYKDNAYLPRTASKMNSLEINLQLKRLRMHSQRFAWIPKLTQNMPTRIK